MAEYINREELLKDINDSVMFSARNGVSAELRGAHKIVDRIRSATACDVVEVVHGCWETKPNTGGYEVCMRCSVCGFQFDNWQHIFKYCPVCGAKMDVNSKTTLPEATKQTILNSFMKGSED